MSGIWGNVEDSNRNIVLDVEVFVYDKDDNLIAKGHTTDSDGRYETDDTGNIVTGWFQVVKKGYRTFRDNWSKLPGGQGTGPYNAILVVHQSS